MSDPAYTPATWSIGYQMRQFGVAGASALKAMSNPPAAMATAAGDPENGPPGPGRPEPTPIYN